MPDVKRPKYRIPRLSVCRLSHGNKLLGEVHGLHPRFKELHFLEFDQDAVQSFGVPLDLFFKSRLRFRPSDDVEVRPFSPAEPSEILGFGVRLQTRKTESDVAVTHKACSCARSL